MQSTEAEKLAAAVRTLKREAHFLDSLGHSPLSAAIKVVLAELAREDLRS